MIVPSLTFVYDRKGQASRTKAAPVELRIYVSGKRKYISTGVKLFPKEWSGNEVSGYKEDYSELNDLLATFKKKVLEIILTMIESNNLDLDAIPNILKGKMIRERTQTFILYAQRRAEVKCKGLKRGTIKHYTTCINFLKDWKGMVYFEDITEKALWNMQKELQDRGLKNSSIWQNYHKIVKSFINDAVDDGLMKSNPYRRVKLPHGDENTIVRYLTPEQFHHIECAKMPTESLNKVRDLFVFQTYTCMSYADMELFDTRKIVDGMYKSKRVKTGVEFEFLLTKQCEEILKRYGGVLPLISNQKYNGFLKAMAQAAGIDEQVTSHWARHTGATMWLNEGKVRIEVVARILGHSTTRETEKVYAKVLNSTIREEMRKLA